MRIVTFVDDNQTVIYRTTFIITGFRSQAKRAIQRLYNDISSICVFRYKMNNVKVCRASEYFSFVRIINYVSYILNILCISKPKIFILVLKNVMPFNVGTILFDIILLLNLRVNNFKKYY